MNNQELIQLSNEIEDQTLLLEQISVLSHCIEKSLVEIRDVPKDYGYDSKTIESVLNDIVKNAEVLLLLLFNISEDCNKNLSRIIAKI